MMEKVLCSLTLLLFLLSSCSTRHMDKDYIKKTEAVRAANNKRLAMEGFYVLNDGYSYPSTICAIKGSYVTKNLRFSTIEQADAFFQQFVPHYLEPFNEERSIRPYLQNFPLNAQNVELALLFLDPDGSHLEPPYIAAIHLLNGRVYYDIYNRQKGEFSTVRVTQIAEVSYGEETDTDQAASISAIKDFSRIAKREHGVKLLLIDNPSKYSVIFTSNKELDIAAGRKLALSLVQDYVKELSNHPDVLEYIMVSKEKDQFYECTPKLENVSLTIAFWNSDRDRPLSPNLSQIAFSKGTFYFYDATPMTQSLNLISQESFNEASKNTKFERLDFK